MTYRGALQLLGKDQSALVQALDRLVGGAILVSPALAGVTALPLAAAFGWVDQKNEGFNLVRQLVAGVSPRLRGLSGYRRHELIKAAHTVIVGVAFFEAIATVLGPRYRELRSDRARMRLLEQTGVLGGRSVDELYRAEVPLPSAVAGFEHVASHGMADFYADLTERTFLILGSSVEHGVFPDTDGVRTRLVDEAIRGYRERFLNLATDVPEFSIWALLNEDAHTQHLVGAAARDIAAIRAGQAGLLRGLERLLVLATHGQPPPVQSELATLSLANRSVLTGPLVTASSLLRSDITFPTLEEGYVAPRFRSAVFGPLARPADEQWWDGLPVHDEVDHFLAAFFTSPESTRLPLLLLGHPGAGKSLLTRVLAARLPAEGFLTVRVPLRAVDADAPIWEQVQQGLDLTTHGRVNWSRVSEEGRDLIRVVLLDGFDELLLATGQRARGRYLHEIEEFQHRELSLERPVAVVVTSRTIVADRARIPDGCPLMQLTDFDRAGIATWLMAWNEANRPRIHARRLRRVGPESAAQHESLARQPLLLLMLALYASDPEAQDITDAELSTADLYRALVVNFVRREVAKLHPQLPAHAEQEMVDEHVRCLAMAAFAMFNRGRQHVTEDELRADFEHLLDQEPTARAEDSHEVAARIVGQFFFVQTSEANTRTKGGGGRTYEFLHATFGEFLIAAHLVILLEGLAVSWRLTRRTGGTVNDESLRRLVADQCLVQRRTILHFARQLLGELAEESRDAVRELLTSLSMRARTGWPASPVTGQSRARDAVRTLACYTANLVTLGVLMADEDGVHPDELAPPGIDPQVWWRSTVRLWWAGIPGDEWSELDSWLGQAPDGTIALRSAGDGPDLVSITAQLSG